MFNSFKAFDILSSKSLYSSVETTYKDYMTLLIEMYDTHFLL